MRAKTFDARGKVGIVVSFGSGVHHAVGIGHRLRGLVYGLRVTDIVLAVGIIGLVVVFRTAADAWIDIRTVASSHVTALGVIGRVVGVVLCHLPVGRAAGENHQGDEGDESECFHFYWVFICPLI